METETITKDTDKMNDFYTKFDDHIRQKYKPSESINKTISFMIPVLASLISAYGLFIECFLNTITSLIKENNSCKQLAKKLFSSSLDIYEFYVGVGYFVENLIDRESKNMISTSITDIQLKAERISENLKLVLFDASEDIINEKLS